MSASRTIQAAPGTQQMAAAFGVVLLAIAVTLVVVFGLLAAPKAVVTAPAAAGAAQPTWDHGASSDASNVSLAPATFDHGASSDASNVSLGSSEPGGANRLRLPK